MASPPDGQMAQAPSNNMADASSGSAKLAVFSQVHAYLHTLFYRLRRDTEYVRCQHYEKSVNRTDVPDEDLWWWQDEQIGVFSLYHRIHYVAAKRQVLLIQAIADMVFEMCNELGDFKQVSIRWILISRDHD